MPLWEYLAAPVVHPSSTGLRHPHLGSCSRPELIEAYAGRKLPTKLVLDSLRDMQAYRSWTPSGTDRELSRHGFKDRQLIIVADAATFKDAHRSVAQLTVGDPKDITIAQLEGVISPEVCARFPRF